jgi:hypothetical protein
MRMEAKKHSARGKIRPMQEVTLPEVLKEARGKRSYNEMGRLCKLPVATIHRVETGAVALPNRDTLEALSRGYGVDLDRLALVAYGRVFEEVPEEEAVSA